MRDLLNLPNHRIYLKLMIDRTPSVPFKATKRISEQAWLWRSVSRATGENNTLVIESAYLLSLLHGSNAMQVACERADAAYENDDFTTFLLWKQVATHLVLQRMEETMDVQ